MGRIKSSSDEMTFFGEIVAASSQEMQGIALVRYALTIDGKQESWLSNFTDIHILIRLDG
jgi:hypothetical protein